jgi:hypothetical protein
MTSTIPQIVSVDDHLIEPPGVWQDRVPARYKDVAPRLETLPADAFHKVSGAYVANSHPTGPPAAWWATIQLSGAGSTISGAHLRWRDLNLPTTLSSSTTT